MADVANAKRNTGATAHTVATNLRRLRESQNLTYSAVIKRLDALGHPLQPLSLRRMEEGDRSVDVDDLTALAVVYDVSPITILMPQSETRDSPVTFTGGPPELSAGTLRAWLRAEAFLTADELIEGSESAAPGTVLVWQARANPTWAEPQQLTDAVMRIMNEIVGDYRGLGLGAHPSQVAGKGSDGDR